MFPPGLLNSISWLQFLLLHSSQPRWFGGDHMATKAVCQLLCPVRKPYAAVFASEPAGYQESMSAHDGPVAHVCLPPDLLNNLNLFLAQTYLD